MPHDFQRKQGSKIAENMTSSFIFLIMRIVFPIIVFFIFASPVKSDEEGRFYELASLKYIYSVELKITGDKVSGILRTIEYGGEGVDEKIAFTGEIKRSKIRVKLEKIPDYVNLIDPNRNGFHIWKLDKKASPQTLFLPIRSRDENGKPIVANMPLEVR